MILQEVQGRDPDIFCMQEVDQENFNEYFRANLANDNYKGIFWPKGRAKTMAEREAKFVDGCAIFYKNSKYAQNTVYFSAIDIDRRPGIYCWTNNSSISPASPFRDQI